MGFSWFPANRGISGTEEEDSLARSSKIYRVTPTQVSLSTYSSLEWQWGGARQISISIKFLQVMGSSSCTKKYVQRERTLPVWWQTGDHRLPSLSLRMCLWFEKGIITSQFPISLFSKSSRTHYNSSSTCRKTIMLFHELYPWSSILQIEYWDRVSALSF